MTDLDKYIIARWAYSVGEPIMENAEWQILHDTLKDKYPDNEYFHRSWSSDPCPTQLLIDNNLTELIKKVIITDKTESIPSLGNFAEIENMYKEMNESYTGSYKHDGWNMQFSYMDGKLIWAQTRGRATNAKEASVLMSCVPNTIPNKNKITVVCEATVSNKVFEYVREKYGNTSQRGSVSTLLANKEDSNLLSIHGFDIKCEGEKFDVFPTLEEWGFDTPEWCRFNNYIDMLNNLKRMSDAVVNYPFPTDGWVVAGSHTRAIRVMAWEEPIYKSFVRLEDPYIEKYGAHRISIAVGVHPIKLQNSTQQEIPMTNLQRVIDMNLQPGMPIAFRLRSSSIAVVDEDNTRLLQDRWKGREGEYRDTIIYNELAKRGVI